MPQNTILTSGVAPAVVYRLDFDKPELCQQTMPLSCKIRGIDLPIPEKQNWVQLLVAVTNMFINEKNQKINELHKKKLSSKFSHPFILTRKIKRLNCAKLSNGKWIIVNYNIPTLIKVIRTLCIYCGLDLSDIVIEYMAKDAAQKTKVKKTTKEEISLKDILVIYFANGFRLESPIELRRFRQFAFEATGQEITVSDKVLKDKILACGRLFDGKVYVVTDETKDKLKKTVNSAFSSGYSLIFYGAFYEKHENWLFSENIVSVDMLKDMLKILCPDFIFTGSYFCKNNTNTVRDELLNCFFDSTLQSYEQLSEKLPYIPLDKIKLALSQNADFIWNAKETYTHINKFDIKEEDILSIRSFAETKCNADRYLSLADISLNDIAERNYELSVTALHNTVFRICLDGKYERYGKIVVKKGSILNASEIMKEYCRSLERCSLDDLLAVEKELTGENHRWIPMEAAYAVMVRTDINAYVSESQVDFDIDVIDTALETFCPNDYIPLRSVTTFAAFPHAGQPWTLFLLESYVRRFSHKFRFEVLSVNSKNCGAIVRKSSELDYCEIMVDAVAKSKVALEKKEVLEFLFSRGYIGKRSWSGINVLLGQAKILRERGR